MNSFVELDLKTKDNIKFKFDLNRVIRVQDELENFLVDEDFLNSEKFAKKVLISREIKANNEIEYINDDLDIITNVIKNNHNYKNKNVRQRIINLYNGYQYIFNKQEINEDNLKKLYSILSKNLLEQNDLNNMGKYYRKGPVYIFRSDVIDDNPNNIDQGMPFEELDEYMKYFFDFVNNYSNLDNKTDYFIISQIMHFYFVYIHPYFDVNGRTSRTVALWYLFKNNTYPYVIFNRAISWQKRLYEKVIQDTEKFHNLTFFLEYMLINVKKELEKEYIMNSIVNNLNENLHTKDYQTIEYMLSMNGKITVKDFSRFYEKFNDRKKAKEIYETRILPLIEKNVINIIRYTKGHITSDIPNMEIELNKKIMDLNEDKIKRLIIK